MKTLLFAGALALAMNGGTATAQENPPVQQDANGMMAMMKDCPMMVDGAKIAAVDTTDGVALTITSETGNVTEVRGRVQRMLDMHG